jgi:hypothetical protein
MFSQSFDALSPPKQPRASHIRRPSGHPDTAFANRALLDAGYSQQFLVGVTPRVSSTSYTATYHFYSSVLTVSGSSDPSLCCYESISDRPSAAAFRATSGPGLNRLESTVPFSRFCQLHLDASAHLPPIRPSAFGTTPLKRFAFHQPPLIRIWHRVSCSDTTRLGIPRTFLAS